MCDYVINSNFSVNSFLLNPHSLLVLQGGTRRSRTSTFPDCTNASRLTRQLQNHIYRHTKFFHLYSPRVVTFLWQSWAFCGMGSRSHIYLGVGNSRVAEVRRRSGMSRSRDETLHGREGILSGEHRQNQRNLACGHNSTHNAVVLPGSQNASTVDYPLEEHRTR